MSMLNLSEIIPGIVVYLNHSDLESRGIIGSRYRNRSGHWFLCLSCHQNRSMWVLLTSCPGAFKVRIPSSGKLGHHTWTANDSYSAGPSFMFEADNWDIQVASKCEHSVPGYRNYVDDEWLANVRQQCHLWDGGDGGQRLGRDYYITD